ncbi:hypothetical protein CFHF_19575 [Caulobacter flavus]|uniref:Uncharacterized protein n=1 Tax=Caulobacter flavus TaxID=1679497 RepID=A0A2N5CNY2_9CAUL|nr:hypothetical protein [Caulobacter flavus]AYV48625.1 hypothetical protein C1707_21495 [Caulobacter flavus]PLR08660.1 hypothetical protein CFHF_19575 [Caulobacter flavus]
MSDRSSATITIGGRLTRESFLALAQAIADEGLSADWDGPWFTPADAVVGQPLRLKAREVAGGTFDELEAWCQDNGLPFVRWCGGYPGSWSPERVVFSGEGEPARYLADEDDEVLLDAFTVRELGSMAAIEAYFADAAFMVPPLVILDDGGGGDR